MNIARAVLSVLGSAVLLAGCAPGDVAESGATPRGGDEPMTPRTLAGVVAEHTDRPTSGEPGRDLEEAGKGLVAAVELRYGNGDALSVGVGKRLKNLLSGCDDPRRESLAGCAETEEGLLFWEGDVAESDPGVVYVQVSKGQTDVLIFYSGSMITADPRSLALPISVDSMFAIAADPRVAVTTSQEAVALGEDADFWREDG